jgi:hypothetical protein
VEGFVAVRIDVVEGVLLVLEDELPVLLVVEGVLNARFLTHNN